jgi:glycosyltransferase involved in cell wall biosynthesis
MLNLSVEMLEHLAIRQEIRRLDVLSNSSLQDRLRLPSSTSVHLQDATVSSTAGQIWWGLFGAYAKANKLGNDWLFLPKGFASFARRCPVRLATCVADTYVEYYKQNYPETIPVLERIYFDYSLRAAIKDSKIIFTISDFTRDEILRLAKKYRLQAPTVRTIGIGFFPKGNRPAHKKERILLLAGRWPHKRTDLAVKYMQTWCERSNFSGTVEWVGKLPEKMKLPPIDGWILHSRMPDEQFYRLMSESKALVYFSDYEGFGMPPVEAAIAGTCPVYSSLPATREVMREAGYLFENDSYENFEAALNAAIKTPPEQVANWAATLSSRHDRCLVVDRIINELLRFEETNTRNQPRRFS